MFGEANAMRMQKSAQQTLPPGPLLDIPDEMPGALGDVIAVPVAFTSSDTGGASVPGSTDNGSIVRLGLFGDCNGDGVVDTGDISACALEIFDGDGNQRDDAPGGSFPGTFLCDSNEDVIIDAGDVICNVLIIHNGPNACLGPLTAGVAVPAALLTIPKRMAVDPGETVDVPIELASGDHSVAATVFAVGFDKTWLRFDPSDDDGNGIPDAVSMQLPNRYYVSVSINQDAGELRFFVTDKSLPLLKIPDGVFATITFEAVVPEDGRSREAAVVFSETPSLSLGNTSGQSLPVQSYGGSVLITPSITVDSVSLYLPLMAR